MPGVPADKIPLPEGPLAVVFMDLDDSVFQTRRKCPPGPLEVAALDREGRPSSYFSFGQRCLLELLSGRALLIPTTARNQAAFGRVQFKFRHGAILNYGGLILGPDGQVDEAWQDRMKPLCAEAAPLLAAMLASAEKIIRDRGLNCRARIIGDQGLDFYVVIKNYNSRIEELKIIMNEMKKMDFSPKVGDDQCLYIASHKTCNSLRSQTEVCDDPDEQPSLKRPSAALGPIWGMDFSPEARIYLNDNNLSLRPLFLDKSEAVTYFTRTHLDPEYSGLPLIGLGDSFSDLEFMGRCDFRLIPGGSQISGLLSGAGEDGA